MTARTPERLAADMIRDLVQGFTTTVTITQPTLHPDGKWRPVRRHHTITHPPLLDQVENATTTNTANGQTYNPRPTSKPAARLDALALLARIDHQSRTLATDHHVNPDQPLRPRLLALSGTIGHEPHRTVRSWWGNARILTHHDGPPMAPDAPCPQCDMRGSLRVRLDPDIATCVECHAYWDTEQDDPAAQFGRLAVWVRWASEHLRGHRHLVDRAEADRLGVEHGYGDELEYVVVCPDCEPERAAMAEREAARLRAVRTYPDAPRHAQKVPA